MKHVFFLWIITITFLSANSQELIKKAKLTYQNYKTIENLANGKKRETYAPLEFMFSNNVLQTKKMIGKLQMIAINKANEETATCYATNNERFLSFNDITSELFEMGMYKKEDFKYRYVDDTLTINGLLCHKAIISCPIDGKNNEIEVWYFNEVMLDLANFKYIFLELKGLPVKVKYREFPKISLPGTENMVIMNELTLVNFTEDFKEDVTTVEDISKYEIVDQNNFQQEVLSMMGLGGKTKLANTPRGEPIKSTVVSSNGSTMELTKYNPFKLHEPLQPFAGKTLAGNQIKMADYENKVWVINFWFIECKPCVNEMPILNAVQSNFAHQPVEFISINHQSANDIENFLKTKQYNFTHIVNAQHLIDLYGVSTYPATIIVDKKGVIQFIKIGDFKNEEELSNEIRKLL